MYREERTEWEPCVPRVLILIRSLSEGIRIIFIISPELVRGFY